MNKRSALDLRDRNSSFAELETKIFDVLVIGAGITGCGVARDASMRGLSVALVDAGDIGAGTSSRSSKLIHGGLRYLAQGDIFVVKEAAIERSTVRRLAPHLAQLMPLVIPTRGKKDLAQMRASLWTYEKLGNVTPNERHQVWDVPQLKAEEPLVLTEGLNGAVVYPECLTDDFRLTLANARSSVSHGARLVTYAGVEEIVRENGKAVGVVVRGTLPDEDRGARVRARVLVNAAGPWVDTVRRMESARAKAKLQLTKGIHVVVKRSRLPIDHTIVMEALDRRLNFAIPRDSFVYIGTTDTFSPHPEYWPEITQQDVEYLLEPLQKTFSVEPITEKDIVAAWAGLRPLLGAAGKKPSEISRRHEIMEGPGGVLSIAGGKLTSFRSMAERVADRCQKKLGNKPAPSTTADVPLPGGDFAGTTDQLRSRLTALGLEPREAERAVRLYGSEAIEIYERGNRLVSEVKHAVENEGALTLEDYWFRRSARARFEIDDFSASLRAAAGFMGEAMHWSQDEIIRHVDHCQALNVEELNVCSAVSVH